jgi:hypothetical protein
MQHKKLFVVSAPRRINSIPPSATRVQGDKWLPQLHVGTWDANYHFQYWFQRAWEGCINLFKEEKDATNSITALGYRRKTPLPPHWGRRMEPRYAEGEDKLVVISIVASTRNLYVPISAIARMWGPLVSYSSWATVPVWLGVKETKYVVLIRQIENILVW